MTNKPPITGPDRNQADIQARRLRQRFRKGVFVIPSLLTTANIFCGFYSVMESLAGARFLALVGLSNGSEHLSSTAITAATEHFDRAAITIGFAGGFTGGYFASRGDPFWTLSGGLAGVPGWRWFCSFMGSNLASSCDTGR